MSLDATSANENTPLDPSIFWERSGVLARASNQGALFSLYLAMQQHSVAEPFEIEPASSDLDKKNTIEEALAALNHYRRPALAANENEWQTMHAMSPLVAQDFATARLYLSLKPAPLAQTNDAAKLPDDIVENCSLATQKRLKKRYANMVKEDNTLLYDILSSNENALNGATTNQQYTPPFENIA